jgi:hypothetical protein
MPYDKKNFKVLLDVYSGLNDVFSAVAYYIEFFWRNGLDHENLHFRSIYDDLNNYLEFNKIKYVSDPDLGSYDFISNTAIGEETNINNGNWRHISNFVKIKEEFRNTLPIYTDYTAVHFRFMNLENYNGSNELETDSYYQAFMKKYDESKNYLIFSDSILIGERVGHLNNVKLMLPDIDINRENVFPSRKNFTSKTISDLYCMSTCKEIFRTKGKFVLACNLFNKNIPIRNLI